MTPVEASALSIAAAFVVVWVTLIVANHFISEETRYRLLYADFVKKGLPKILAKTGVTGSIWIGRVQCPRDGSRLYQGSCEWYDPIPGMSRNFDWFCPVCGYRGYGVPYAGLNTPASHNSIS